MFKNLFVKRQKSQYGWFGNYSSWAEVAAETGGYDAGVILERTKEAILKVKKGEAVYERDSVVFDKKEYPFPLITFLLHSASLNKKPLHVLDFGGSLGSTYFQVKEFLTPDVCASWNVVEQGHYVECGKAHFEDEILKFYESIDACKAEKEIDLVVLSSSIQYLEKPHDFLKQLAAYHFPFLLFDRTAFHYGEADRLTLQRVPPEIYPASYPSWFFNEKAFLSHFSGQYEIRAEFTSYVKGEETMLIDEVQSGYDKGFYLINSSTHA
ncbi:TIGR04325 family methyltransferase [Pedobacter steynii]|uniref:Methyltransferase, TIGR04325 family n=1 Tax=Pedobacter steynii TaxID=430522 RepID=A0A1D7QGB4_9SPHI|nr:TIGR04325 family methyltransferase [Pedobacter steynii]AOM77685.1 methyltransferase, TIGR04325 family [Pedobacter steynii]